MQRLINTIVSIAIIISIIVIGFTDIGLNDFLEPKDVSQKVESRVKDKAEEKVNEAGSIFNKVDKETILEKDEVVISRVIDGDTVLVITPEGEEERVRLLLIDTPESVHPNGEIEKYGPEASDYAKEYLKQGQKVVLERGNPERDKYDRLLAYIWVEDINFNKHMVEKGYARVAYVYPPNNKYEDEFRAAEKEAKKKKLNIWSITGYVTDKGFDMSVVD